MAVSMSSVFRCNILVCYFIFPPRWYHTMNFRSFTVQQNINQNHPLLPLLPRSVLFPQHPPLTTPNHFAPP